jgi:hypothetical protein
MAVGAAAGTMAGAGTAAGAGTDTGAGTAAGAGTDTGAGVTGAGVTAASVTAAASKTIPLLFFIFYESKYLKSKNLSIRPRSISEPDWELYLLFVQAYAICIFRKPRAQCVMNLTISELFRRMQFKMNAVMFSFKRSR